MGQDFQSSEIDDEDFVINKVSFTEVDYVGMNAYVASQKAFDERLIPHFFNTVTNLQYDNLPEPKFVITSYEIFEETKTIKLAGSIPGQSKTDSNIALNNTIGTKQKLEAKPKVADIDMLLMNAEEKDDEVDLKRKIIFGVVGGVLGIIMLIAIIYILNVISQSD